MVCRCGHPATRHLVRLKYKGDDLSITRDKVGRPLRSYAHARRLLEHIRWEIDNYQFDPSFYKPSKLRPYLAEHYFPKWLDAEGVRLDQGQIAPETYRNRRRHVRYWAESFKGVDVREIRYAHLEDFANELHGRLSAKSVWNCLRDLQTCLRWTKRRGDIQVVPEFPQVKFDRPKVRWIDADTQSRVLAEIPQADRPLFEFLVTYGRRPGEAKALMWDCIDWEQRTITIRRTYSGPVMKEATKAHTITVLPMLAHIEAMLRRLPRSIRTDHVFINRQGRYYAHPERIWKAACEKVGVNITLYEGTRHSFVTQKIRDGHPLDLIGEAAGHTTAQTTRRYVAQDATRLVQIWTKKVRPLRGG